MRMACCLVLVWLFWTSGCLPTSGTAPDALHDGDAGSQVPENNNLESTQKAKTTDTHEQESTMDLTIPDSTNRDFEPMGTDAQTPRESTPEAERATFKDVTIQEAKALIQQEPGLLILDIRTPKEFAAGHLNNAQNIDFFADDFRTRLDQLDKHKTYLVYCASARRSTNAMSTFRELGFLRIYNMLGGFNDWKKAGFPSTP